MSGIGEGRLILIIEDNEKNLKLARDVLRFHGFRTIEAVDGESGVALARERSPDLILMDVGMPGLDGIGATALLKADPLTSGIPVVAVTASVMQAELTRLQGAGFAGVIAKPIGILKFSALVLAYCRR